MCYQPSVFDPKNVPSLSTHELRLYMKTVQFKLSLDSLGEIYQQNHWMELNLRRLPLSLLTLAHEWKMYRQLLIKEPKGDISIFPNQQTGNHMLVYSHFNSTSGTKFLRHEINKESPS